MLSEEEYIDDEYIESENDPFSVREITEKNSIGIEEKEEVIEFDKVYETVKTKIVDFINHDKIMEEKVLDALRSGKLK